MESLALHRLYFFQLGVLLVICAAAYAENANSPDDAIDVNKKPMWMPNWMNSYMKNQYRSKRPMWVPNWMMQQFKSQYHKRPNWVPNWASQQLMEQHQVKKRPMWVPNWISRYMKDQHRIHKKPLWTPSWQLAYIQAARRQQRSKRPGSYNPFNWLSQYTVQSKRDHTVSDAEDNTEDIEVRKRPVWIPFNWQHRYLDLSK